MYTHTHTHTHTHTRLRYAVGEVTPGVYKACCGVISSFLQQLAFNLHHRTAMAAAAVARSRGVASGLFFLFTLMCLVCLASSLMDKDKLEEMKKNLQETQQNLDKFKAQRHAASELMDGSMGLMDPLMAFLKKTSEHLPVDSLPLVEYMENIKSFMEKTKTLVDGINRETDVKIEKTEKELGKMNNLIKALEEHQAEL